VPISAHAECELELMAAINGRSMKAKGSAFERDVCSYLKDHGHPFVERSYGAGRPDDRGDIDGIPGWCLELKNCRALDLAGWVTEATAEAEHARSHHWAVVAKRRNRPVSESYVVMSLSQFAELVGDEA
jgi:hypothetical protein